MRRLIGGVAVFLVLGAVPAAAQRSLESAAEHVRHSWKSHTVEEIVDGGERIKLQLPGKAASEALEPSQAQAVLRDFLGQSEEVETSVRAVREVAGGRGYAELERRYRAAGAGTVRTQTLLLGYRRAGQGWALVEVRVVE